MGGGMAGRSLASWLSPGRGAIEVQFIPLREAEFEMISLRFDLPTAPAMSPRGSILSFA